MPKRMNVHTHRRKLKSYRKMWITGGIFNDILAESRKPKKERFKIETL